MKIPFQSHLISVLASLHPSPLQKNAAGWVEIIPIWFGSVMSQNPANLSGRLPPHFKTYLVQNKVIQLRDLKAFELVLMIKYILLSLYFFLFIRPSLLISQWCGDMAQLWSPWVKSLVDNKLEPQITTKEVENDSAHWWNPSFFRTYFTVYLLLPFIVSKVLMHSFAFVKYFTKEVIYSSKRKKADFKVNKKEKKKVSRHAEWSFIW